LLALHLWHKPAEELDRDTDKGQTRVAPPKVEVQEVTTVTGLLSEFRSFQFPDWQPEFEAAMQESDQARRTERLQALKIAIFLRLKTKTSRPPGTVERIALNDAIHLLRVLRTENIPYLDWENS
jgi:hypothetical protein